MGEGDDAGPLLRRLAWLVAIWAMSLGALSLVALIIRLWLKAS